MQYSDMTRHRKQQIKSGLNTDAMIINGVKRAANFIKKVPSMVGEAASESAGRGAKRIMKSKWWNS